MSNNRVTITEEDFENINMAQELFNTQARINVMAVVLNDIANVVASTAPQFVVDRMTQICEAWDKAECHYPMFADDFEPEEKHNVQ